MLACTVSCNQKTNLNSEKKQCVIFKHISYVPSEQAHAGFISGFVLFEEQLDILMSNRTHLLLKFLQLVCEYDVDYMFSENPRPSVTWTSLWESITDFLPVWPRPSWRTNSYLRRVCPTPQLSLAKASWMRKRVNSTR